MKQPECLLTGTYVDEISRRSRRLDRDRLRLGEAHQTDAVCVWPMWSFTIFLIHQNKKLKQRDHFNPSRRVV